ncbi:hypothetical protein L1F28_29420 [Arthrospira platensis NCB002]|uniref:hypothetical protein n=2 Tax=Limnospira platensis TaxID=118562 RepID=UPI0002EC7707|nr:hypothetical protein APPUASWS_000380 [Arthrospira platensis str. Paraca]MDF2212734.1 hypothetical protein [Arthrospira platensis NCB002]MDF2212740.1 hypothetical protein [Arthrospira platensis NCB002]
MMMIYPKAIALHNQEISTVGWELRKLWVFTKKRSHSITTDIYFGLRVEEILGIYQKAIALHNQEISTLG